MTKGEYYFLAASLPDIEIGTPPDLSFYQLSYLLRENLRKEDLAQTIVMRRYYDLQNIRAFLLENPLDHRGFYDENRLEENLLTQSGFPEYVFSFLNRYEQLEERIKNFPSLIADYFRFESEKATGFLKEYLLFERDWRLIQTAFRAKRLGRDVVEELQFEDPYDEIVAQILAQKDAKTFEPPTRYSNLKALFDQHADVPMELHQAFCEYRFQKIDSLSRGELFSMERILSYMAQLIIVEKWLELDEQKGMEVVKGIVEEVS